MKITPRGLLPAICLALALGCLPGWAQTSATFTVEDVAGAGGSGDFTGAAIAAASDSAGNPHIADKRNQHIRKVDATSGAISAAATGARVLGGDSGSAIDAMLHLPDRVVRSVPRLEGNEVRDLPSLWRLTGLEALGHSSNGIDDMSRLSGLRSLVHPHPEDHRIANIPLPAGEAVGVVATGERGGRRLALSGTAEADLSRNPNVDGLAAAPAAAVGASGLEPAGGGAAENGGFARMVAHRSYATPSAGVAPPAPPRFALAAGAAARFHSPDSQTPYPPLPLPLEPPPDPRVGRPYTHNTCPEFHKLDGEDLVQAILTANGPCITTHISYPPRPHLQLLFSEEKMITIIRKFKELAEVYQGSDQDKITYFLEYVYRGYYYRHYNLSILDQFFTDRLKAELHQGLATFVDNSNFTSTNEEHLGILYRFINLLRTSYEAAPYVDQLIDILDRFSLDQPMWMRSVIGAILFIYRSSHWQHNGELDAVNNFEFRDHVLSKDAAALEALVRFSTRDDLLNSDEIVNDTTSILYRAVEEIGRFLQYGDYPDAFYLAHDRLEEILSQYSVDSDARFLRFLASNAIKYWSRHSSSDLKPSCSTDSYDICNDELDWREALFPPEYSYKCQATDDVIFKFMSDVPTGLKKRSCAEVLGMDHVFHKVLKTRRVPVVDDHNDLLEVIVFSSRLHMMTYGVVYGADFSSIGGAYYEGNPYDPDNIPRVYVHESDQPGTTLRYVNVLGHEFIHYLDGRYNKSDRYNPHFLGDSLWWTEGLATGIPGRGKYTGSPRAVRAVTTGRYRLDEIFPDANSNEHRTYFFGSLVVQFLVEKHFDIARELIDIMRDDWWGWNEKLDQIGTDFNDEFDAWLDELIGLWQDPSQGYCLAYPRSDGPSYIASLSLAGRQIPTYLSSGYSFPNWNSPIMVSSGGSYRLDIVIGTSSLNSSSHRMEVWVDWNDDTAFSNSERMVHTQVALSDPEDFHTLSHRLEVPANTLGTRRMRVRVSNSVSDACSSYGAGETEDYALEILPEASSIAVRPIPEAVNSFLRVRSTSQKELRLRDIFHVHSDHGLTYTATSFDPHTVAVTLTGDTVIIRNRSSRNRTSPVKVVLTATNESRQMAEKEIYVLFEPYSLPLFLSTEDPRKESFVRVVNRSNRDGSVSITATGDSGEVRGPVSLPLGGGQVAHFNSRDLEEGNAEKGIEALGRLGGQVRLTLESDLDFKALNYVRASDGFLTSMNEQADFASQGRGYRYFVPIFNPASNRNQQSVLKLFNHGEDTAHVTIRAVDDGGRRQTASLDLAPGGSQAISANELENGADFLTGSLGDGEGKWRFQIDSTQFIEVINLMKSPTGHLSNLSSQPSPTTWRRGREGSVVSQAVLLLIPNQESRQGFVRIINRSPYSGEVTIQVMDDAFANRGQIRLAMEANSAKHFNSRDLANGDANKGIPQGFGDPQGMWQLRLESELDVQALSYMRASDGFLTKLYGALPMTGRNQYAVDFFNPASNRNQRSLLRLINDREHDVSVYVTATDDLGTAGATGVRLVLPARTTKTLNSLDLEGGGDDVRGSFGDGEGKWRLAIETSHPLAIMNLMESPNGYLSNLCTQCLTAAGGVGIDHGDARSSATTVALPSETDGRIEPAGDVDYFRFEVAEAREVTIGTTGDLDTVGTLEDGEGGRLASNDNGGSGGNFSIRRRLSAGTYHVRVESDGSSTGPYALRLTSGEVGDDHGDARSSATEVSLPSETAGRIESGADVDYFRFEVAEASEVTVGTTGGLDTVGTLEDRGGGQLASNDDGGSGGNFSIRRRLSAGTYHVRVESYASLTGTYTLALTAEADEGGGVGDDHGDLRSSATEVTLPSETDGRIDPGTDVDYFRFEVAEASEVTVGTTGGLNTVGTLEDGEGGHLASDDDGGSGLNFSIRRRLSAGTYHVRVESYGLWTGAYTLALTAEADEGGGVGDDHGDARSSATEVALPSETDGRIDPGTDVDYFRFEVAEASEVTVGTTGGLDTVGTLEDGEGGHLARDDDGGSGRNFSIRRRLSAGTYHVRVESFASLTGPYTLRLTAEADDSG